MTLPLEKIIKWALALIVVVVIIFILFGGPKAAFSKITWLTKTLAPNVTIGAENATKVHEETIIVDYFDNFCNKLSTYANSYDESCWIPLSEVDVPENYFLEFLKYTEKPAKTRIGFYRSGITNALVKRCEINALTCFIPNNEIRIAVSKIGDLKQAGAELRGYLPDVITILPERAMEFYWLAKVEEKQEYGLAPYIFKISGRDIEWGRSLCFVEKTPYVEPYALGNMCSNKTPTELYEGALKSLNLGYYYDAITAIKEIIAKPKTFNSTQLEDAYYYNLEVYHTAQNWDATNIAFWDFANRYPNSQRLGTAKNYYADASVHIGDNYLAAGNYLQAILKYVTAVDNSAVNEILITAKTRIKSMCEVQLPEYKSQIGDICAALDKSKYYPTT